MKLKRHILFYRTLLLCLTLALVSASSLRAQPTLSTNSALGFFSTVADKMLQSQPGLSITNIPIYPTNRYTPALHRLLQLAANIYDASTNRAFDAGLAGPPYYPSVFRPTFNNDGTNIFINGFVEEGDNCTNYAIIPLSLPEDAPLVNSNTINIYGIPWVIGARKGFPNFNEISMESISQITRMLEIDKHTLDTPRSAWTTNQMYVIGISNVLGVEAWNSYVNYYPRGVELIVAANLTMVLTNETGILLSTNLILAASRNIPAGTWAGFSNSGSPNLDVLSFVIPIYSNMVFLPDSIYRQNSSQFEPSIGPNFNFETTAGFPVPSFGLNITNHLRFTLRDPDTGRIIDFVQLNDLNSHRDLVGELPTADSLSIWSTNRVNNNPSIIAPTVGIQNQMQISLGNIALSLPSWNNEQLQPVGAATRASEISSFINFFLNQTNINPAVVAVAPFNPTEKIAQYWTWQANDPLVHYTVGDLTSFPQTNQTFAIKPPNASIANPFLANLGRVNLRYHPWPMGSSSGSDTNAFNLSLKDPLVSRSDDWDFPNGLPLSFNWLGRVHRGTPWQTLYLKSAAVESNSWQAWTGNGNPNDAVISRPTNDWHLAGLLASLLNTNNPRALLSVNQINLTNWSSTFSNGITVLTNITADDDLFSLPPQFSSVLMDSNSAQLAFLLDGINAVRTNQPGQSFTTVGDILAAPELSTNSPWLNLATTQQLKRGITDAAYETIPSQILASLRLDSIGSLIQADGQVQLQFSGLDGYPYVIEASTNLQDWIAIGTAYPTNGLLTITDPDAAGLDARFYRSLIAP